MPADFSVQRLRTVQLVPLTAFDREGRLSLGPMRTLNQRLFDAGVRTFIPCAGSAEFHVLSSDEIVQSLEMTCEVVGQEGTVIAPVGHRVEVALELGKRATQAGASAALIMPLAFPYLADAGARDYLLRLLDELPCPAIVYKKDAIPSDSLLLELAEHPNMLGVKYAVNDIDAFNRLVRDDGGRLEWYCGSAERFSPFFALAGATGYTSGAGNICPRLTLAMHAALAKGSWTQALQLQRTILPIEEYRARAANSYYISFLKHAITRIGLDFGPPRPPYRQLSQAEEAEIDHILAPILAAEQELAEKQIGEPVT